MGLHWFSRIAKFFLYWILMVVAATGVFWVYVYSDSVSIIRDRTNDLSMIVAEENCLSEVYIDSFNELLYMSETPWLKFKDRAGPLADRPYQVVDMAGGRLLYSYAAAPQRGKPVYVKLTGSISLPYIVGIGEGGLENDVPSLDFEISQDYVVMGLKFYKDKE